MQHLKTTSLIILSMKIKNFFENLEDNCWRESSGYKYDKAAHEDSFFFFFLTCYLHWHMNLWKNRLISKVIKGSIYHDQLFWLPE